MIRDLQYNAITEKIIGCAMKVHQKMRNGYTEIIYQRCPAIEFKKAGLSFVQELELPVYYDDICVGKRRVDFLVEEKVIVELKALTELTNQHLAQALNYPETHNVETGLLINFGAPSLQFKRLINRNKKNPANPQ